MIFNINSSTVFVFDLDDTLYKEVDFVRSAYKHIAAQLEEELCTNLFEQMWLWFQNGESCFDLLKSNYDINPTVEDLVGIYRHHKPMIEPSIGVSETFRSLRECKVPIGILTDGRGITQRNKLSALGFLPWIELIIISEELGSEKPSKANYQAVMDRFRSEHFVYLADNTAKDFVTANELGWDTICLLDDGRNIHPQDFTLPQRYLPKYKLASFADLKLSVN
ncbi:MAG: HAD family hydrolase [Saprospiraceae bacterium]|nr:HAD family hydrolase [Saprospiraceae bacterium]